ncbi:MAG: peptidoglycan-binding protein [Pseudomonadota bacterium]
MMKTSAQGVAFIEAHEGVVLNAYRDPVGIWTIGAGLTAASGVVTPKAGMKLSRSEATELLMQSLDKNYEPRVRKAMPGAQQHEFDGGVSFDFNTGGIFKASWVARWRAKDSAGVRARIKLWNKAGGRVLAGLVRRREEEAELILEGNYFGAEETHAISEANGELARLVGPAVEEVLTIKERLDSLGYAVGDAKLGIRRAAVVQFQSDHGLHVDGIVGAATLATLQRRMDARKKAVEAGGGGVAIGGATAAGGAIESVAVEQLFWWLAGGIAIALLVYGLVLAIRYRDIVAANIAQIAPRAAAWLRSW